MAGKVGATLQSMVDRAAHMVQGVAEGLAELVENEAKLANVVYRQQVPSDRWYYNYKDGFSKTTEELAARGWAIIYTIEGAVRAAVEAIRVLFAKYITKTQEGLGRSETILRAQFESLKYTAWAIIDPIGQKRRTHEELLKDNFLVGCPKNAHNWGDKYEGTLTIPINLDYNWHPMH